MFGPVMSLPSAVTAASPFEHVATMPAEPFDGAAWAALWCLALVLLATGHGLLARRDLR
jgi:ABC-2 type transport system permease protein